MDGRPALEHRESDRRQGRRQRAWDELRRVRGLDPPDAGGGGSREAV